MSIKQQDNKEGKEESTLKKPTLKNNKFNIMTSLLLVLVLILFFTDKLLEANHKTSLDKVLNTEVATEYEKIDEDKLKYLFSENLDVPVGNIALDITSLEKIVVYSTKGLFISSVQVDEEEYYINKIFTVPLGEVEDAKEVIKEVERKGEK